VVSGTGGPAHGSVSRDRRRGHQVTGSMSVGAPRRECDLGPRCSGDAIAIGQPCQQPHERGQRGLGGLGGVVVADDADELAESLVPACCVSCYRAVETAGPTFPDTPVSIDQEVVGDVIPSLLSAGVIVVEASEDSRSIDAAVTVAGSGVVHDEEPHVLSIQWTQWRPIRCPRFPGVDGRCPGGDRQAAAGKGEASCGSK